MMFKGLSSFSADLELYQLFVNIWVLFCFVFVVLFSDEYLSQIPIAKKTKNKYELDKSGMQVMEPCLVPPLLFVLIP